MNPPSPTNPREQLEVRIVALLLGEASPFETAELEAALAQDPELAAFRDRMQRTIGLVGEASRQPTPAPQPQPAQPQAAEPKLSPERREKLLQAFRVIDSPKLVARRRLPRWEMALRLAAMVAILGLVTAILIPNFVKARHPQKVTPLPGYAVAPSTAPEKEARLAENTIMDKTALRFELSERQSHRWDRAKLTPSSQAKSPVAHAMTVTAPKPAASPNSTFASALVLADEPVAVQKSLEASAATEEKAPSVALYLPAKSTAENLGEVAVTDGATFGHSSFQSPVSIGGVGYGGGMGGRPERAFADRLAAQVQNAGGGGGFFGGDARTGGEQSGNQWYARKTPEAGNGAVAPQGAEVSARFLHGTTLAGTAAGVAGGDRGGVSSETSYGLNPKTDTMARDEKGMAKKLAALPLQLPTPSFKGTPDGPAKPMPAETAQSSLWADSSPQASPQAANRYFFDWNRNAAFDMDGDGLIAGKARNTVEAAGTVAAPVPPPAAMLPPAAPAHATAAGGGRIDYLTTATDTAADKRASGEGRGDLGERAGVAITTISGRANTIVLPEPQGRDDLGAMNDYTVKTGPSVISEIHYAKPQGQSPLSLEEVGEQPKTSLATSFADTRGEGGQPVGSRQGGVDRNVALAGLLQDGRALYENGKLEEAQQKLNEVAKLDPENRTAAYYRELVNGRKYTKESRKREVMSKTGLLEVENQWGDQLAREQLSRTPARPSPSALSDSVQAAAVQLGDTPVAGKAFGNFRSGLSSKASGPAAASPLPFGTAAPAGTTVNAGRFSLDGASALKDAHETVYSVNASGIVPPAVVPPPAKSDAGTTVEFINGDDGVALGRDVSQDLARKGQVQEQGLDLQLKAGGKPAANPESSRGRRSAEIALPQDGSEVTLNYATAPQLNLSAGYAVAGNGTVASSTAPSAPTTFYRLTRGAEPDGGARPDAEVPPTSNPVMDESRKAGGAALDDFRLSGLSSVPQNRPVAATVVLSTPPALPAEPQLDMPALQPAPTAASDKPLSAGKLPVAKLRQLQESRDKLIMQIVAQDVEAKIPKSTIVEVVDPAGPETTRRLSVWEKLGRSLGGTEGREARTAAKQEESKKSTDMAKLDEKPGTSQRGTELLKQQLVEVDRAIKFKRESVNKLQDKLALVDSASPATKPPESDAPVRRPATPIPTPQPEILTRENAFSTFSLNVSDVSFKLAQAGLQNNQMPDPGSIRVEEFLNAFHYRDPAPTRGSRIALAWESARYPFAHNRDILRLGIQTAARGREAQRPLNLVILLDNSGSMERPDRVAILREALRVLAAQLRPQDRVSVVAFARSARLWVDGMAGGQPDAFLARVLDLNPEGGTNLEEAMNLGYATAARHFMPAGVNRVILLTDGAANLGNVEPEDLKKQVVAQRQKGIALDCFGIGWEGYNDDLLEVLAHNGDGRYGFLNTPEQAAPEFADQLAGALNVAAADVKTQVEFNPFRVTSWRQIGYAKHQLTKQQFRDNTVDAAEIAAAEQGNALYVIETNPQGSGPIGTVRVRFRIPETGEYVEQEWPITYQPRLPAADQASPALRLAVAASGLGEWLSTSPYAAEVTLPALQNLLAGVPEIFAPDPRPQQLATMIRQAQVLGGK